MRKLRVIACVGLCLVFLAGTAIADPYVSGNLGFVSIQDSALTDADLTAMGYYNAELSFDKGFGLTAAIGNKSGNVRYEGELGYRAADIDQLTFEDVSTYYWADLNGDISMLTLMGNVYYDFSPSAKVSPFITAGLGLNMIDADLGTLMGTDLGSESDTVLAFQVGGGASLNVSENANLDLTYRYLTGQDPDLGGTEAEASSHNLFFGVRIDI